MVKRYGLRHWGLSAALTALMCVVGVQVGQAQTTNASVQGTVVDAQKAVMPGVTVTLTSKTQGNEMTAITDEEGRFSFPVVRPDTYVLKASLEGFKTLEQTNLMVNANDKLSAGTLTLEVGSLSESISVSARVTELQATSGERSFTMENTTLTNVANNGRMLFNFATLVPGVAMGGDGAGREMGSVSAFTVNGQRPNSNNMTIDGVANIDTGDNGGNMATTSIDSVAEFKVLTNAYQAEYGRAVGGQIQVVTKSGSNVFHGSGYWYGRRSDWNATSWMNHRNNTPVAKASRDDKGYTVGGPVMKQKLFFFWSQEFQSRKDPVSARVTRVPTALERTGDFSQSLDSGGSPFPYIRDYTTGLPCSASDTRGCFQDGGVVGKIPANRLYSLGLNMLKIYPAANGNFGGSNNFSSEVPNSVPRREDLIRVDYQVSDKWRVTGRYMNTKQDEMQAYGTTWAGNGSDQLPMPVFHPLPGKNWMVSTQGILSNTMSLEASIGSAKNELTYEIQGDQWNRSSTGLSGLPMLYPNAIQSDYIPMLNFRGGRTGNAGVYDTDNGPFANWNQTYDVITNLTKVWGPHTAKAGIYYQHSAKPQAAFANWNGNINFTDNVNNPYDSGFGYANAALGVFNSFQQANTYAMPYWTYQNVEFFAQDNWKVGKLTLDYGVRFYYMTPQYDKDKGVGTFLPDKYSAADAAKLYYPVCVGNASPCSGTTARRGMNPALVAAGVTPTVDNTVEERFIGRLTPGSNRFNGSFQAGQGVSDTVQSGSVFRVSPRLGVVYDISGTGATIMRGGWGIFYDRPQGNTVFDMANNAPTLLQPTLQYGLLQNLNSGTNDPYPTLGQSPTAYNFDPPYVQQWNMGVQQKLPMNMVFDLAYVGSKSEKLLEQDQINAVPLGARWLPANQDPTKPATGNNPLPDDLLRPYKGYGGIRMWDYRGYSNYHGMNTGITKRYDKGYMFSAFYVWSKALGTANTDWGARLPYSTDDQNRAVNYSFLEYDRPHNFVMNAIYQVPKLTENKAAAILINDWQLSGVYRWNSGRPYAVGPTVSGVDLTGGTDVGARVVLTCDPGAGYGSDPYKQFDTSCFKAPSVGSNGNESARFTMRMPPINNVDMSISKSFKIYKQTKFEIRADAFNALNHTQFTTINSGATFSGPGSSTITNLPYNAAGELTNKTGFGSINGVAPPRTFQIMTRFTF